MFLQFVQEKTLKNIVSWQNKQTKKHYSEWHAEIDGFPTIWYVKIVCSRSLYWKLSPDCLSHNMLRAMDSPPYSMLIVWSWAYKKLSMSVLWDVVIHRKLESLYIYIVLTSISLDRQLSFSPSQCYLKFMVRVLSTSQNHAFVHKRYLKCVLQSLLPYKLNL